MDRLGAWRSLVARTVRVGEVPGSNPGAPIELAAPPTREHSRKGPYLLRLPDSCSGVFGSVRWPGVCRTFAGSLLECVLVSAEEIDAYLSGIERPDRDALEALRRTILELVPEAEQLRQCMPTQDYGPRSAIAVKAG